jgi:hypothetical protein
MGNEAVEHELEAWSRAMSEITLSLYPDGSVKRPKMIELQVHQPREDTRVRIE